MNELISAFYHMAEAAGAELKLVPEAAEAQVQELIELFDSHLSLPFAPHVGAHGLVFGEWGHGKTQVLYRLAARLSRQSDRVLVSVVIPEDMSPRYLVTAAAGFAERAGLPFLPLQEAAAKLTNIDSRDANTAQIAARAFARCAADSKRPHAALLFDEAQTVQDVGFQEFLKELREAFRELSIVLHTLQCHSLVSLDRAVKLSQDLGWLQGPAVRKVNLPSLRDDEAFELFRSRLQPVAPHLADRYISPGIARTICRLVGGNPRNMLTLAQDLAREVGPDRVVSGDDLVRVSERQPGETPGSSLFVRGQLKRLLELLPQVWEVRLGTKVASELTHNIGRWFGEDMSQELSTFADRLGVDVPILERNLRRPIDGVELFDIEDDDLGATVLRLSFECRRYLSRSFANGGDFNEKQVQFDCLMAPTLQHRALADALRLTELGEVSVPVMLGNHLDGAPIRGYELRYQVPTTSYTSVVLLAPMLGVHWPVETARTVVERLHRGGCTRAIVLDLAVHRSWLDWDNECKEKGLVLPAQQTPPDLRRIDGDTWGSILPAPGDAADYPAARAAVLCAALCGAERAHQNRQPTTDDQERARRGIVDRVRDLLPSASELCYLPSQEQQQWLDLPLWSTGLVDLATLRETLGRPQLTAPQLGDLVPHWLEGVGTRKWLRRPWAKTALAVAALGVFKEVRGAQRPEQLAERLRGRLPLPHPERLENCLMWLLSKLQAEGLVEIDLLGAVKFRDLRHEIRENRIALQKSKSAVQSDLSGLERLSYNKWSDVRDRAQKALEVATSVAGEMATTAPATVLSLNEALEELRSAAAEVKRETHQAEQALDKLVNDVSGWLAEKRKLVASVHAAWREVLGLNAGLEELERIESGIKKLAQGGGDGDRDRLGRATVDYQRARVWNLRLESLLRDGGAPDGAYRTVAAAVLSGEYQEIRVGIMENA